MFTGIALGSNVGDRLQHLREARDAIAANHGVIHCSRVYETEPVGCEPGSAAYLNAVIEIVYPGDPILLLGELQTIESRLGRPSRHPRNAPRTIDLDILYAGNLILQNEVIAIPHPRLHERRFVLAPLCDIRPDLILPGQQETANTLLASLPLHPLASVYPGDF
ncbi:MAG: 2-amino-4-hydroxy-6-hydroxymethyldihydropteridine diphosphokinase [Verrucomicrobiota bacterium]